MADYVVLASGSGSNFEAIATSCCLSGHRLLAVISDRREAPVLRRAERLGVPSLIVSYEAGRDRAESRLLDALAKLEPDLIVLAGFMKILPSRIVERFRGHILNIHPALLPGFPGRNAIKRAYAEPGAAMGITVHFVDEGVDTGPVLARVEADRSGDPGLEEMEARIHALEHHHYPRLIAEQLDAIERATER